MDSAGVNLDALAQQFGGTRVQTPPPAQGLDALAAQFGGVKAPQGQPATQPAPNGGAPATPTQAPPQPSMVDRAKQGVSDLLYAGLPANLPTRSNAPEVPSPGTVAGGPPAQPKPAAPAQAPPTMRPELSAVGQRFAAYRPFLSNVVVSPGTNSRRDDRQVEFYPPWESENPHPGKLTVQPYRPELSTGEGLTNTVAGELLHYIGGVDPSTGKPVDPAYQQLKQAVAAARTPQQQAIDQREYEAAKARGDKRSFNDWFNQSRLDEYIMGYVTPDQADDWRKNGWYDAPQMKQAVENVRQYLTHGPPPAAPTASVQASSPTWSERLLDTARNSPLGHAVQQTFPGAPDWMKPTTRQGTEEYQAEQQGPRLEHLTEGLTREQAQQALDTLRKVAAVPTMGASLLTHPTVEKGTFRENPADAPTATESRLTGAAKVGSELVSAPALAQFAGIAMGGGLVGEALAAPFVPEVAGKVFHTLLGAGFTAQMAHGVIQQFQQYHDAKQKADQARQAGDEKAAAEYDREANELIGGMSLNGVLTALGAVGTAAGAHGVAKELREGRATPAEPPAAKPAEPAAEAEAKPTLHTSDNVEELRASAERQAPAIGDAVQQATEGVPGAKLEAVRDAKDADRIEDKADRQGVKPSQIGDLAAAKVTVPDQAAAEQVLENLNREMPVQSANGEVTGEPGKNDVRQMQATVRTGAEGEPVQHAEVLLQTPEMNEATAATHDDYRKAQEMRQAGDEEGAKRLEEQIAAQHQEAEQAAQQRLAEGAPAAGEGGRGQSPEPKSGAEQRPAQEPTPAPETDLFGNPKETPAATGRLERTGDVARVPVNDLSLDPKRFQYKMNTDATGVTNLLKGRKWNEDLAGVISVWRDPADDKLYVVNGHHRFQLARETGRPDIAVRMIEAPTANAARATGALQNIAEGRGTAMDAAKFFRDSGYTAKELNDLGVSMGEATAANGVALSRLDPSLFDQVVNGKLPEGRAIAIGNATDDPAEQEAILKLIQKAEGKGKHITNDTVNELARMVRGAGQHTESQATLFGEQEMTHSLALEKAEISSYIRKEIGQERRTFASVADAKKAGRLASVEGQSIKADENAAIAKNAAMAQELYDRLSVRSGTIDEILNRAARELADGGKANDVKSRAYDAARKALAEALGRGEGGNAERVQAEPATPQAGERRAEGNAEPAKPAASERPATATPPTAPAVEAPKTPEQRTAWKAGRQSTPVLVRDAEGKWVPGTLEHWNPGFNGGKASGRVRLHDEGGTQLRNVPGGSLMEYVHAPNGAQPKFYENSGTPREKEIIERTRKNLAHLVGEAMTSEHLRDKSGLLNIATDAAKELFPEFQKDPTGANADVQSSAGAVNKAVLATVMKQPVDPARPDVMITTASPGSGKTTSLRGQGDDTLAFKIESIFDELPAARKLIQNILNSGRNPMVYWSYVDDPAKTVDRMFTRAIGRVDEKTGKFKIGIGRTVPLDYMAQSYSSIPKVLKALKQEFGDKLNLAVIDNSGPVGTATFHENPEPFIEKALQWNQERTQAAIQGRTEELRQAGRFDGERERRIYETAKNAGQKGNGEGLDSNSARTGSGDGKALSQPQGKSGIERPEDRGVNEQDVPRKSELGSSLLEKPSTAEENQKTKPIGQLSEQERAQRFNAGRDAAKARTERENAAEAEPEPVTTPHGKMLALDPDSAALWHRVFAKVKDAEGRNVLGAGSNWRGMSLGQRLVNMAAYFLRDRAEKLRTEDPAAATGYERMAKALEDSRNHEGGVSVLRGDYRDDTMHEEAVHAWDRRHRLSETEAMREMAQEPIFAETAEKLRSMGYGLRAGTEGETELAAEMIGKAIAGDKDLALTPEQREQVVRQFLTRAVQEEGRGILNDLPAVDDTIRGIVEELRNGEHNGQRVQGSNPTEAGSGVRPGGGGVREEAGPSERGGPEREPRGGQQPEAASFQRGGQEGRAAEDQLSKPTFEKSGKDLGAVFHGGPKPVAAVDSSKLGTRDAGFYGSGFYVTRNEKGAGMYGPKVSEMRFAPDARVLDVGTIHPEYEHPVDPELQSAVEADERAHLEKAKNTAGRPEKIESYLDLIRPKSPGFDLHSWIGAVNRFAEKNGYDAINFGDSEIVVKNPDIIKGVPKKELGAMFQRARGKGQAGGLLPEDSFNLPGMEGSDQERAQAYAAAEGQRLSEAMRRPLRDISKAAGEMERNSPLFFGKGEQPDLFSQAQEVRGGTKNEQGTLFDSDGQMPLFQRDPEAKPGDIWVSKPHDNEEEGPGWKTFYSDVLKAPDERDVRLKWGSYVAEHASPEKMQKLISELEPRWESGARMMLSPEKDGSWAVRLVQSLHEGKGAATALYRAAIDYARSQGAKELTSDPEGGSKDAVAGIWKKLGAVETPGVGEKAGAVRWRLDLTRPNQEARFQRADGSWAPFEQQTELPYEKGKEPGPKDHIASLDALTDSLARRLETQPKKSALAKVAEWSSREAEASVERAGKFWGGIPGAFRQALSWGKAVSAAIARDWTNSGLEQNGWKDAQKELILAQNESSMKIKEMAEKLTKLVPDEKTGTAAAIWAEANGDEATLRRWATQAKSSGRHNAAEYEAALNLSDDVKGVVHDIRQDLDELGHTAVRNGIMQLMRRNYVRHMLDTSSAIKAERLIDASEVNPNPAFAKQRVYKTIFEAEQNGEKFRTKDLRQVLAAYHDSFNQAMASRAWIRSMLMNREADGRPTFVLRSKGPWEEITEDQLPQIVRQGPRPESLDGYRLLDRPQLRNFMFKPTEEDLLPYINDSRLFKTGKENYAIKGDLMVHPDRIKAVENMLTPDWFHRGDSVLQKVGRGIQKASALVKEINTFGAPFHLTTEAENALEHWVNPFKMKPIDLTNEVDRLGAMNMSLYNYDREGLFGAKTLHGLLHGFPGLSNVADLINRQANWMFEDYIPKLKMETFRTMFRRNLKSYPELTREQVAELTGKQVDATYGNVNHALDRMPRNKTAQAVARLLLFAPDFLEARARLVAGAFNRYGGQQRAALARGALMLYVVPRILNAAMNNGDAKWNWHDMFTVVIPKPHVAGHEQAYWRFSIKSPFTEMLHLVTDPRMFAAARENPMTVRPALEMLWGRDEYGRRKDAGEQVKDFFKGASPFLTQKVIETPDESLMDSVLSAFGAHMSNYRSPTEQKVHQLYIENLPSGQEDPEKVAQMRSHRQLEDAIREGTKSPADAWRQVEEGKLTAKDAARITRRAEKSRLEIEFAALPLKKAMDVYEDASVAEQAQLHDELERKQHLIEAMPEADREAAQARLEDLLRRGPRQ